MQVTEASGKPQGRVVVVHDDMPMRRAQLAAFLSQWAESEHVELVTAEMPEAGEPPAPEPGCRMVIFSIGSLMLERSVVLQQIVGYTAQYDQLPVVLLTEAGSARDAATAFQAGARGYIPASIEPEVALNALTFILNGGHFFPPTALHLASRGSRGRNHNPDDPTGLASGILGKIYRVRRDGPGLHGRAVEPENASGIRRVS